MCESFMGKAVSVFEKAKPKRKSGTRFMSSRNELTVSEDVMLICTSFGVGHDEGKMSLFEVFY